MVTPPAVTLHFSPLPPPECCLLKKQRGRRPGAAVEAARGGQHTAGVETEQEWLATGLAVGSPGWVVSDPAATVGVGGRGSSASEHSLHDSAAAVDELSLPVGVAWDKRRHGALHLVSRDFSTVATARLGDVVAAGTDRNGDSEVTAVSSNVTIHRIQRRAGAAGPPPCVRVEVCPSRGLVLGASLQPPELHLSSFSSHKQEPLTAKLAPAPASASVSFPSSPEEISLKAEGDFAAAVGGGLLAVFRTSGGGRGRETRAGGGGTCAMEQLGALHLPSKGKVLRCKFITSKRGRVAVLLVQAGESSEDVTATSMMVECVDSTGEGDGAGGFRLVSRSSAKMVNANASPAVGASSAAAAEWDEWGREVVLGACGGALSVHSRGRPDGDTGQVAPALRVGRVPGGGTPSLLRWGRVGGDAVLAVAVKGGHIAMMLPSLQPLNLVTAPSTSPHHLRRVLVHHAAAAETEAGAPAGAPAAAAAMCGGAEGRVAFVTPRVSGAQKKKSENKKSDDDDIAFIEWDGAGGRFGGAWGRLAVVMASGCAAVVDVAPDAPAAACGESRGALGAASAARDLPALEDLIVGIMRRGPGGCGRAAGDPAAAAMVLNAAAAAAWRVACSTSGQHHRGGAVREGTAALIRRVVQWRAGRGELEGAYSLAHMTGDRAALEDVYCAALRQGSSGVMSAARDRLAEESSGGGGLVGRHHHHRHEPPFLLPSTEELAHLAALEARAAAAAAAALTTTTSTA